MIPELSDEAGITEVQVNGTKGVIAENVINVVLPVGASLTEDPGDIVITLKHEKAKVEDLKTADQGATWSFSVIAEDGVTVKDYIINVSIAEDIKGQNEMERSQRQKNLPYRTTGPFLWIQQTRRIL